MSEAALLDSLIVVKMLVLVEIRSAGGVTNDLKEGGLGGREMVHPVGRDKANKLSPICEATGFWGYNPSRSYNRSIEMVA